MKHFICLVFIAILLSTDVQSQDISSPWNVGISAVKSEYRGDLGKNLFDWKGTQYYGVGLQIKHYINPTFDLGMELSISDHGYWESAENNFLSMQYQTSLQLAYKFNNGYILREQSRIAPYLQAGVGYTVYESDPLRGANTSVFNIPLALGFKVRLGNTVSMFLQSTYNLTNADDVDMVAGDVNANTMINGNDHFLNHQLGLSFDIGNRTKKMDIDGDGFSDYEDACPEDFGVQAMQGCPDSDMDGISDLNDPCPNQAGSQLMGGCPDTDQDGIADHEDECPVNAGSMALRGCPDSDNDGVTDAYDKCPNFAGSIKNKGCPMVEPSTRDLFRKANNEVVFEEGSSRFEESSILILQDILGVLQEHPYYELIIEAHIFDESKEDADELKLSQDRADVIKEFLINNGIEADKLVAVGYGSYKPHYLLANPQMIDMNERLEFKINF